MEPRSCVGETQASWRLILASVPASAASASMPSQASPGAVPAPPAMKFPVAFATAQPAASEGSAWTSDHPGGYGRFGREDRTVRRIPPEFVMRPERAQFPAVQPGDQVGPRRRCGAVRDDQAGAVACQVGKRRGGLPLGDGVKAGRGIE